METSSRGRTLIIEMLEGTKPLCSHSTFRPGLDQGAFHQGAAENGIASHIFEFEASRVWLRSLRGTFTDFFHPSGSSGSLRM